MSERQSEIVQLRIELTDTDPLVWRRVQVPAGLRLRRLHDVIQAVFDWWNSHLYQFEVGERLYGPTEYDDGDPVGVQLCSDRNVSLRQLIDRGCTGFLYRYDFGDDWEHLVMVETTGPAEPGVHYPVLVDGARRAPPEDIGGPPGFDAFLEAMADPNHPEHAEFRDWYGGERFDPADLNLKSVDARLAPIRASQNRGGRSGR